MSSSRAGHVLTHRLRDTPCQKACHLPVTTAIDNVDSECDEQEVLDVPSSSNLHSDACTVLGFDVEVGWQS